jgi:DNA-nicking Smr family endonuclease
LRIRFQTLHFQPAVNHPDEPTEPVPLPITGELDLHSFRPGEIKELLPEYFAECRSRGILEVRVVHGKGIGQLRASVHAILGRLPEVESFGLATATYGGHGATWVRLKPGGQTPA